MAILKRKLHCDIRRQPRGGYYLWRLPAFWSKVPVGEDDEPRQDEDGRASA